MKSKIPGHPRLPPRMFEIVAEFSMPASSKPLQSLRRATSIQVSLDVATTSPRPDLRWIRRMIIAAAEELSLRNAAMSFVIVDDAKMAGLHRRFSGVLGTTDVLTFDLRDDASAWLEGEIYLCIDEARRRARELGHDADRELLLYAVHGILHLLGHDDHAAAAHKRMHAEEDRILHAIGVGPVYRDPLPRRPARPRISPRTPGARS